LHFSHSIAGRIKCDAILVKTLLLARLGMYMHDVSHRVSVMVHSVVQQPLVSPLLRLHVHTQTQHVW
jgi:hypothetical protein